MSKIIDIANFYSDQFSPILPEECQVNPTVYGAELAYWLALELANKGVATSYPEYEDWVWFISWISENESEFDLYCRNIDDSKNHWEISLKRYARKLFGRDKPPYSEAMPLIEAVKALLEENPSVSGLDWRGLNDLIRQEKKV